MSADRMRVLSPFSGRKKRIPPNKKQRTVMTKENRQNLVDRVEGHIIIRMNGWKNF